MPKTKTPPALHICPQCGGLHKTADQLMDCCIWQHVTPAERLQMQAEVETGMPLAQVLLQHGAQLHQEGARA